MGGSKFESLSNSVGNSIFGTVLTEQLELVIGWNSNRIRRNSGYTSSLGSRGHNAFVDWPTSHDEGFALQLYSRVSALW